MEQKISIDQFIALGGQCSQLHKDEILLNVNLDKPSAKGYSFLNAVSVKLDGIYPSGSNRYSVTYLNRLDAEVTKTCAGHLIEVLVEVVLSPKYLLDNQDFDTIEGDLD